MADLKLAYAHGGERIVPNTEVERLTGKFNGEVLRPADPRYDEARTVWNGMVDKHPGLIARCTGTEDVCLRELRQRPRAISVCSRWRTQLRGQGGMSWGDAESVAEGRPWRREI